MIAGVTTAAFPCCGTGKARTRFATRRRGILSDCAALRGASERGPSCSLHLRLAGLSSAADRMPLLFRSGLARPLPMYPHKRPGRGASLSICTIPSTTSANLSQAARAYLAALTKLKPRSERRAEPRHLVSRSRHPLARRCIFPSMPPPFARTGRALPLPASCQSSAFDNWGPTSRNCSTWRSQSGRYNRQAQKRTEPAWQNHRPKG